MSHMLAVPSMWSPESGIVFLPDPPAVAVGQTRYWTISASKISQAEKDEWNTIGARQGMNFTSSPANPSVSADHYSGVYWPVSPLRFGPSGVFEFNYPGFSFNTSWQKLAYTWQAGGVAPNYEPSAIFTKASATNNNQSSVRNRHFRRNLRYRFGFDFCCFGIEAPNAPKRVTLWKTKPYQDTANAGFNPPDYIGLDSSPTIGIGSLGAPPGGAYFRVIQHGDSDLITPDVASLEVNDTTFSASPVRDNRIYRVRAEVVYDLNSNGELYVWLSEDGGVEEQVVNQPATTTFLNTNQTTIGDLIATRNPYFGGYITGSGTNTGKLNLKMDNLYIDCDTV